MVNCSETKNCFQKAVWNSVRIALPLNIPSVNLKNKISSYLANLRNSKRVANLDSQAMINHSRVNWGGLFWIKVLLEKNQSLRFPVGCRVVVSALLSRKSEGVD